MKPLLRQWVGCALALVLVASGISACGAPGLSRPGDRAGVRVSFKGQGLKSGDTIEVAVLKAGTTIGLDSRAITVGSTTAGALSVDLTFGVDPGTYDFRAELTPSGATTPTHMGLANGVVLDLTRKADVDITLFLLNRSTSVTVKVDDRHKPMPATVTGVTITPSNKLYGGELVKLAVQTTSTALSFGWKATMPIVLDRAGGATTTFRAPTKLGKYSVTLYVIANDGKRPASLTIPLDVIKGGLIDGSAKKVLGTTGSYALAESIAFSGTDYAVAWRDIRPSVPTTYFRRLSSVGTPLGSERNIRGSSSKTTGAWGAKVVWTGSEFGVVWADGRNHPAHGTRDVYFARVDAAGNKLGSEVRITSSVTADAPSLVWTGSGYGVAWHDTRHGASNVEIYFRRLSGLGAKIGAETRVTVFAGGSTGPSLVFTGTEYGVAWTDARYTSSEMFFARLSASTGLKVGSDVRVTTNSAAKSGLSLAHNGSWYRLAWADKRDGNFEIYSARISSAGAKVGIDKRETVSSGDSLAPEMVWTGSAFAVAYEDLTPGNREIFFLRLDGSNAGYSPALRTPIRVTSSPLSSASPHLVTAGREIGIAWYEGDTSPNPAQVHFARISEPTP